MEDSGFGGIVTAIVVVIVIILGFWSATVIDQNERGVLTRFGEVKEILEPGFHLINPFTQDVTKMDISVRKIDLEEQSYSKDSQVVTAQITVNYRLNTVDVRKVYEDVKRRYQDDYVIPRSRDVVKEVISGYTAQGLIENRGEISSKMQTALQAKLESVGISVSNISVTNLDFDDAYETAVQNKQVQEQQALAQVNITKQEEEKKKQEILKAEALSEKTRLEVQALESAQGEKIIEKIRAEAQLELAKKWNGQMPTNMYSGSPFPVINVQ